MKRLITTALLAGGLALLPNPQPADAQSSAQCLREAIESCDRDFPGGDKFTAAIRGWCYMIRYAMCMVLD